MTPSDWPAVREIYVEGIATGLATFETEAPEWAAWDRGHSPQPRLVAVELPASAAAANDEVLGWAALSPVSSRCVYAGVAEVSIYIAAAARGRGVGKRLLGELVAASEAEGLWTLQAGIFASNDTSIRLHERAGFRVVGVRHRLGQLAGHWQDVVLMERRSDVVGT